MMEFLALKTEEERERVRERGGGKGEKKERTGDSREKKSQVEKNKTEKKKKEGSTLSAIFAKLSVVAELGELQKRFCSFCELLQKVRGFFTMKARNKCGQRNALFAFIEYCYLFNDN
ncbi:hypothetical protein DBV15_03314 [Temnothorax longispinosus]|uniref:Uncharacterized protein n=1 Tax=Temnothorax longispinosus TaxID=300112 RepID=A0A4S2JSC0_9HYME|nr:hypothetical protein DBV15_03314 [Temnothorax longispinosus]